MPRYFFHVEPVGIVDVAGIDLPDHGAAKSYASAVARMMVLDEAYGGRLRIVVKDENDDVVHEEPLN